MTELFIAVSAVVVILAAAYLWICWTLDAEDMEAEENERN